MNPSERIIVSLLIYGTPQIGDWHRILYQIMDDLSISNLGTIQADIKRILECQQLYKEYCIGCKSFTGNIGLEIVPTCSHCTSSERSLGLYIQYFLHFLFSLPSEGIERRALYQELYRSGIIHHGTD